MVKAGGCHGCDSSSWSVETVCLQLLVDAALTSLLSDAAGNCPYIACCPLLFIALHYSPRLATVRRRRKKKELYEFCFYPNFFPSFNLKFSCLICHHPSPFLSRLCLLFLWESNSKTIVLSRGRSLVIVLKIVFVSGALFLTILLP